jgi:hypothetical protein
MDTVLVVAVRLAYWDKIVVSQAGTMARCGKTQSLERRSNR